jgi:hypothetical protein
MSVTAPEAPPIKYLLAYYGTDSWTDLVLRWNGSGTEWSLYRVGETTPLYTGTERQFGFIGEPSSRYDFRVETTVGATTYDKTIMTYTSSLPSPIGLEVASIGDTAVTLKWNAQSGTSVYEVCDVTDSYRVIHSGPDTSLTVSGLTPSARYSYSVRSKLAAETSRWSAPVTFFTLPPDSITPGVYSFSPISIYTWAAGRPGSTDPYWIPAQSDWFHGDGYEWNDNTGVQTTYFFYGSPNPFGMLRGAVVSKCEVFIDRYSAGGDPGPVLSRLALHTYQGKPDGEPFPTNSQVDAGTLSRGESAWVEVPTEWATQLIIGAFANGVAWGGVPERYQLSKNMPYGTSPRIGDIRVTVA